ncbi:hypothetical protein [Rubrivirga marina]|uniref:Uncharacterized protein n=1 Tax=Rubrivirga marina TaxID=1196024 RepID=A0A271IYP0_9BACT|nr:hypothetical protein [Rubrivirga marina]PAP76078.1 hypothetical protein BSZ37_06280 [Rubrivirga marina]
MSRKRRRPTGPSVPNDAAALDGSPAEPGRVRGMAWRLFPFRGRFLSPETRYVYERLPEAPTPFTSAEVAGLCAEASGELELEGPCNPAEVMDLLVSRTLVVWAEGGFVKRRRTKPRPKA